jgi:SAM-dependent methyltransferase
MADWGTGSYELTAEKLAPVAEVVADAVDPVNGRKVLDLACGTGNAALIAAERGAKVTGLDAAPRLLEVARGRAADAGVEAEFVEGSMLDLPFPDASFEIVTSVFGVIFADQPDAVAAEIGRVVGQRGGRIALTTWTEKGLLPEIAKLSHQAFHEVMDIPPEDKPPFRWGDEVSLRELFSEHGIVLQVEERSLTFTAESAQAANDEWNEHHPMWIARREALGDEKADELSERILELLEAGNESTDGGFSYTSTYLLAVGSPV